jgi:hypothetical protein
MTGARLASMLGSPPSRRRLPITSYAVAPGSCDAHQFREIRDRMIHRRRSDFWLRLLALVWLSLGLSGCADELGPQPMPVARVRGKVTEGARPFTRGFIEFFPIDGTVGNPRSARIQADGSFETDKVAIGLNLIRLVDIDTKAASLKSWFGAYLSPIRRMIPKRPAGPIEIDVIDEWIQFKASGIPDLDAELRGTGEAR